MKKRYYGVAAAVASLGIFGLNLLSSDAKASEKIDLAEFKQRLLNAYDEENNTLIFDGNGLTVEWSASSSCALQNESHSCQFDSKDNPNYNDIKVEDRKADGNNPQRVQESGKKPNTAQYWMYDMQNPNTPADFRGEHLDNVYIENVNFKFIPTDEVLICVDSGYRGLFYNVQNAELRGNIKGNTSYINCTFDHVLLGDWYSVGTEDKASTYTVKNCEFNNVIENYAIKDIMSQNVIVENTYFTNCDGSIYLNKNGSEPWKDKKEVRIVDNYFDTTNEEYVEGQITTLDKYTRGLIQFSSAGDYSKTKITIENNTSVGISDVIRQHNTTITNDVLDLEELKTTNNFANLILTASTFGDFPDMKPVYYNGTTYKTFTEAAKALLISNPGDKMSYIYCKPKAAITMQAHVPLRDNVTIYGNGANITQGHDFEIDTYMYDRNTGNQVTDGLFFEKDITINIYDLGGVGLWGQRNTDYKVTANFYNCKNMNRVYITGSKGELDINLDNCSFDSTIKNSYASIDTAVYFNSVGKLNINNSLFNGIAVPINMNNKSDGIQEIKVTNTEFINCATFGLSDAAKTYGANIRALATGTGSTNLTVDNCTFTHNNDKERFGEYDIILGDGRFGATSASLVSLDLKNSKAIVSKQSPDYFGEDGTVANPENSIITNVPEDGNLSLDLNGNITSFDDHSKTVIKNEVSPTTSANGYTGDIHCAICDKLIRTGDVISKLPVINLPEGGLSHALGSKGTLVVNSDAHFNFFEKVLIDGDELIKGEDYEVKVSTDKTINIVLTNKLLESLNEGEYTITIISENGEASAVFNILPTPEMPEPVVPTSYAPALVMCIFLPIFILGFIGLKKLTKKNK